MRLQGSVGGAEWNAALLQMTSQTWLPDEVSPSSWNHSLVVISPKNVSQTGWCFLYVAMGFYGSSGVDKAVEASNPDVQAAAKIAVSVGIPAAVLFNVPAELLTFKSSASQGPLVEDRPSVVKSTDNSVLLRIPNSSTCDRGRDAFPFLGTLWPSALRTWSLASRSSAAAGAAHDEGQSPVSHSGCQESPKYCFLKAVVRAMDAIGAHCKPLGMFALSCAVPSR